MSEVSGSPALNLDQLVRLHSLTKDIAQHCHKQLRSHIDTLAPLFRPRRFLGDFMEGAGREPVVGSDKHLAELQQQYKAVAQKTFDLRPELSSPVESVATQMQLYEWEYTHEFNTDRGWRSIAVTAPLTWVLTYSSNYSLSMMRQVLAGRETRNEESVRAFVLRACLVHQLFARFPGLTHLLQGLRYRVEVRRTPQFGDLPLVTISAPFSTNRPEDDLVLRAAGMAGGSSFTEVVDLSSIHNMSDPFRVEIERIMHQHGGAS